MNESEILNDALKAMQEYAQKHGDLYPNADSQAHEVGHLTWEEWEDD